MNNLALTPLFQATWETLYMVFVSSFLSIAIGLCCGVALFVTKKGQILERVPCNRIFGGIINTIRSLPFIILLISIIPLTRLIVGTSIGTNAAIVPLVIAAIPFFARITENALNEVGNNLIETALAMGATNWQIIYKILIPEARPSLIRGATLTTIGLIGYSAMAGAVGGGGLGELAINFGYQRFNPLVMIETVIVLIVIVQLTQTFGDYLAKQYQIKPILIGFTIIFFGIIGSKFFTVTAKADAIKVGIAAGPSEEVMQVVKNVAAKRYGLKIKLVIFNDYVLPNTALENGNLDANIFQHIPYLDAQSKAHGYHLLPIAKTYVYPMGFYSRKISNIADLRPKAIVAIPNDPSNEGRALLLLQKKHLVKLKASVGLFGTPQDVINNPKNLQFKTLDNAQLPRILDDAELVGLTDDYVKVAGFTAKEAVIHEGADSPYANVVVVRANAKDNPLFKKLVAAVHSPEAEKETLKLFPNGAAIPAWE